MSTFKNKDKAIFHPIIFTMSYQTLTIVEEDHIAFVKLNRPEKANALNQQGWDDLHNAFVTLDKNDDMRVIVLSGEGNHFCSGIDISLLAGLKQSTADACEGRTREKLRRLVLELQDCINAVEKCRKPVIAAIHGACVGGGLDLAAACDMRYSTEDALFTIKEIDLGMVADLGSLQRLPRLIGESQVREMAYTGRNVPGVEAKSLGLVNKAYPTVDALMTAVRQLAATIAAKSPLAIRGTKEMITYARDHTTNDSLNYIATWNAAMLMSEDLTETIQAKMEKRSPTYRN